MSIRNENLSKWVALSPGLVKAANRAYSGIDRSFVCPEKERVFRAFEYFPPEQCRVVILGQDPYHTILSGRHKASGLAFGYHPFYRGSLDSSLSNIREELIRSGYSVPEDGLDKWRTLEHWAEQGVLLLNTRLTVEQGKPMSHSGQNPGWKQPVAELIHALDQMHRNSSSVGVVDGNPSSITQSREIVWLLWGNEAQKAALNVQGSRISTSHPCKFSHTNGKQPFTGSNCFVKVNEMLRSNNREEIKW